MWFLGPKHYDPVEMWMKYGRPSGPSRLPKDDLLLPTIYLIAVVFLLLLIAMPQGFWDALREDPPHSNVTYSYPR